MVGGCNSKNVEKTNGKKTVNSQESDIKIVKTVGPELEFLNIFKSEEDMINSSEVDTIIIGEVKSTTTTFLNREVGTLSTIIVDEVLKGNVKTSEEILVDELGGIITTKEWEEDKTDDEKFDGKKEYVKEIIAGYEVMKPNQKVILYLTKCNDCKEFMGKYTNNKSYYTISGALQGKMTLKNGKYISSAPEEYKLKGEKTYTKQEFKSFVSKTLK